ncbi:MAG: penicillin-binding protein activator LpoB [Nitrospirae bacterium]|nr:penicillin-binding protein activator LpoB [Nitrospirota bacterium]
MEGGVRALSLVMLAPTLLLALGGCSSGTKVTRVDEGVVTDLSGRWNDTDSRLVAEAMVKEALGSPWLENYVRAKSRQPVVVVGSIVNRSHDHINVQTFITDLSRELTNSQKVTFVAGKGEREEIREERREQAAHAREDTQKAPGKEIGADFMLKGNISTILDEAEGVKAVFYQVDLEMIDLENNVKSWFGQKKIKKVVERKRMLF